MSNSNVSPSREANYPESISFAHASVLDGLQPEVTDGTYALWANYSSRTKNVYDTMIDAMSDVGGSPYEFVTAYDPDSDLNDTQDRYDTFDSLVSSLDAETDLTAAIDLAVAKVDADVISTTEIDNVVTATDTRMRPQHLRDVMRTAAGFFEARAVMTTSWDLSLASLESQRQRQITETDAQLRLYAQRERADAILRTADMYLAQITRKLEAERIATALQVDIARNKIVAKQDETAFNLDVETRDATYDLELFNYHHTALAALQGVNTLPRIYSGRERLMGAVTNSASAALQFGTATGNPGVGALTFVATLGAQLFGLGAIGK